GRDPLHVRDRRGRTGGAGALQREGYRPRRPADEGARPRLRGGPGWAERASRASPGPAPAPGGRARVRHRPPSDAAPPSPPRRTALRSPGPRAAFEDAAWAAEAAPDRVRPGPGPLAPAAVPGAFPRAPGNRTGVAGSPPHGRL